MPDAELRDLRDVQFAQVESGLLRDPRIPYGHKALYALLITYGPSRIFPGQGTLAAYLNVSRATVNRWLGDLKDWGIITWIRRKGTSNLYALLGYANATPPEVVTSELQLDQVVTPASQSTDPAVTTSCNPEVTRSRSNDPDPLNEIWIMVLAELELVVGRGTFDLRYSQTRLIELGETHAKIQVNDLSWYGNEAALALTERHLSGIVRRPVSVVFV